MTKPAKKPAKKPKKSPKKQPAITPEVVIQPVLVQTEEEALEALETDRRRKERDFLGRFMNPEKAGGQIPRYRRDVADRVEALTALEVLRKAVLQKGRLDDSVKNQINEILNDHSNRLKAVLVGLSQKRIDSIIAITQDLDRLEDELSSRNLGVLTTTTLLQLHTTLAAREKQFVDFISAIASLTLPERMEDKFESSSFLKELEDKGVETTISSRRKVLALVDRIVSEQRKS